MRRVQINAEILDFEDAYSSVARIDPNDWDIFLGHLYSNWRTARRLRRLQKDINWFMTELDNSGRNVRSYIRIFQKEHPMRYGRMCQLMGWVKEQADDFGLDPEAVIWHL